VTSTVHRFPKWLLDERFEITHAPALDQPFGVVLFDKVSGRYSGCGHSIAEAAKAALKQRDSNQTLDADDESSQEANPS
jgi:hypothetical protein